MARKKNKELTENWYQCLNCDSQFLLYEIFTSNSIKAKCPFCESKEFILSKNKTSYNESDYYHYSNYDIYNDYY